MDSASCGTGAIGFTLASTLALGGFGAYSGEGAAGNILDTRIYDHALSQSEISALAADGPNGNPVGAVLSRPPLPAVLSCLPASLSRGFR